MVKKYAILLVRVSTLQQDYEPQVEDLKQFAKSKGYNTFKIIQTKESGLVEYGKKVGLNELFSFTEQNPKYKVVFATEISRLSRRQSVLHKIKEWLVKNQIQLFVKDYNFFLLDESGQLNEDSNLRFSLWGMFAESELRQKKERFQRAKKAYMEMGLSISGRTLFGYEKFRTNSGKNSLKIHPQNAEIVRTIYNWYLNGIDSSRESVSIKGIAIECIKRGFPRYTHSKRNINKLLKEEGYTGVKVTNNKRKNPLFDQEENSNESKYIISNNKIIYPIIIDDDTFKKVKKKLKENNSKVDKSTVNCTILSKILRCNSCGSSLIGNYRKVEGRDTSTYRCSSRTSLKNCKNKQSISMSMIDSAIWCMLKSDFVLFSEVVKSAIVKNEYTKFTTQEKAIEKRVKEIDENLEIFNQRLKNLSTVNSIETNTFLDTMISKIENLTKEKRSLTQEGLKLKNNQIVHQENYTKTLKELQKNPKNIEKSKETIRKCVATFIESVDVVFHNSKYSIIKVFIAIPRNLENSIKKDEKIKKVRYIILDKTVTQDIKAYKFQFELEMMKNGMVHLNFSPTSSKNKLKSVSVELFKLGDVAEKYMYRFQYSKLTFNG